MKIVSGLLMIIAIAVIIRIIIYIRKKKLEKMQKAIIKHEYEKIQEEKNNK